MRGWLFVALALVLAACGQPGEPEPRDPLQGSVSARALPGCELEAHPLDPRLEIRDGLSVVEGDASEPRVGVEDAVRAARRGSHLSVLAAPDVPAERLFAAFREALHGVGLSEVSWVVGSEGRPVALPLARQRGTAPDGDPQLRLRVAPGGLFIDGVGGPVDPSCERGTSDATTPTIAASADDTVRLRECLVRIAAVYPEATLTVEAEGTVSAQRLFDVLAAAGCAFPLGIAAADRTPDSPP